MADRRSTTHDVWISEDDHVWLAAGDWRVDVTQLKAQHDRYREALERAARLAEQEPDSLAGQVVRDALASAESHGRQRRG